MQDIIITIFVTVSHTQCLQIKSNTARCFPCFNSWCPYRVECENLKKKKIPYNYKNFWYLVARPIHKYTCFGRIHSLCVDHVEHAEILIKHKINEKNVLSSARSKFFVKFFINFNWKLSVCSHFHLYIY